MKDKTLYTLGGSIVGLIVVYFGYKVWLANREKKLAEKAESIDKGDESGGTIGTGQQSSKDPKPSRDSFPLKVGSYGYKVFVLQSALNKLGASLDIDGKFGSKTYNAILDNTNEWNLTCRLGNICGLDKEEFDTILKNAEKEGWQELITKAQAEKNWLPFVDGDDYAYSNLKI